MLSGSRAGSADSSSGRTGAWCRPAFSPMQCTFVACTATWNACAPKNQQCHLEGSAVALGHASGHAHELHAAQQVLGAVMVRHASVVVTVALRSAAKNALPTKAAMSAGAACWSSQCTTLRTDVARSCSAAVHPIDVSVQSAV